MLVEVAVAVQPQVGLVVLQGLSRLQETSTASHLLVPQDGPLFELMQQPVLFSNAATPLAQVAQLVGAEVDLEVALLGCSVVAVGTLEGLFSCVCAHVQGQDAVEAETFAAQGAGVLPVLASVIFDIIHLGHYTQVLAVEELLQIHASVQATERSHIYVSVELIG